MPPLVPYWNGQNPDDEYAWGSNDNGFRPVWDPNAHGWHNAGARSNSSGGGPGGGGPGGGHGGSINADDFASTSSSYSGPPKWLADILEQMGANLPQFFDAYNQSIGDYEGGSKGLIENQRKEGINQYQRDFRRPMQQEMRGNMLQAGGAGRMGSSSFADSMAGIGERFAQSAENVHSQTNQRAQEQLLQRLQSLVGMRGGIAGLLGNTMGLARYGESESYNPSGILGLLPFLQ